MSPVESSATTLDKPEQILRGAMQIFLQSGYAGTSMDRVAEQAGVSKHTIYNHFQDKQGLFIALIERLVVRHFHVQFGCELPVEIPPEPVLRQIAAVLLGRMDDPEYIAFIRLVIAESGRFPELAQLYFKTVIQHGNQVLSAYLRVCPDLQIADPEMTAHIFLGSLVTYILSQEVLHGKEIMPIEQDRLVDNLIQMILKSAT